MWTPSWKEVLSIVDESNDQYAIGMAYGMLGARMMMAGRDNAESRALAAKGLAALQGNENRFGHAMVLFALAMGARFNQRFEEARTQFTPLIPIFREMGDYHRSNMVRSEMAHMERQEGRHDQAEAMYRETILEWKRLGHRAAVANQWNVSPLSPEPTSNLNAPPGYWARRRHCARKSTST